MFSDRHAGTPLLRGPDRPWGKTAAAVRADIVQPGLDAVRAERAFERTNARLRRVRRQVLVAIFAVRPELQRHARPMLRWVRSSQIMRRIRMPNLPRFRPLPSFRDAPPIFPLAPSVILRCALLGAPRRMSHGHASQSSFEARRRRRAPQDDGGVWCTAVIPGRCQRVRAKRGPMTGSASDPESRGDHLWIPGSR